MKALLSTLRPILLGLALTTAAVAGPGHGHHHHHTNPEVKAYYEANVLPVVQQQRQKLEAQLTPADRTQLASYRTQLRTLRQRGQSLRQSSQSKNGEAAGQHASFTDAQKQEFQKLCTSTRAIMTQVREMAQRYEEPIAQLKQEVAPQQEKWQADIKAIRVKNATPEQLARHQYLAENGTHHSRSPYFRPAMFLLMEPAATTETASYLGSTSVYPNPVVASSQLLYDVRKAGPVTIELLDAQGKQLRTLAHDEKHEKGQHTLPLNLSDLPNGTYYYKIITRSGAEAKRVVKE